MVTSTAKHAEDKASLDGLSIDILSWLLSYLTVREVACVSEVSQRLFKACRSNALWKLKFAGRWRIDDLFRVTVSGQNWYRAYQAAYRNIDDLWVFHWNITFPEDGLVPGRCCIYDHNNSSQCQSEASTKKSVGNCREDPHDICPRCRFFPSHPLHYARSLKSKTSPATSSTPPTSIPCNPYGCQSPTEAIAQATDQSIQDFCHRHGVEEWPDNASNSTSTSCYSAQKARIAFQQSATFGRRLNTQQYTAATPRQESESTTCLAQLKDLLFFNVTEEPLSTKEGAKELQHLQEERTLQQEWEQNSPFNSREQRRSPPQDFLKPAYETAHHTWHQVVLTNPDFTRPLVFRILVQRPDCFTVFPSEGFLEAGQSKVITFGVRPLGSLVATAFETINAQRMDVEEWMKQVYQEEGKLPTQPFVIRYKYSSVIPCVPARGFVSPRQPQPRQQEASSVATVGEGGGDEDSTVQQVEEDSPATFPSVADVCWENKQMIDYHWSGADPSTAIMETHEVRSIYLSAHVNAHYPFGKLRQQTLTPFLVATDVAATRRGPSRRCHNSFSNQLPMLYFAAPQLYEFYPQSVYAQLQHVQLETEVSHAGQVFRSHRHKCFQCGRTSWGPRLEEMGQAFVLAKMEDWAWQRQEATLQQNGITIVRALLEQQKKEQSKGGALPQVGDNDGAGENATWAALVRTQQLLYVVQKMVLRYRSAPYVNKRLRAVLTRLEILSDCLYGINMHRIQHTATKGDDAAAIPWRKSGSYRHATSTASVFDPEKIVSFDHDHFDELVKEESNEMDAFRYFLHTPGRYNLGALEDSNHEGELVPRQSGSFRNTSHLASATDMFMDDPIQSLRFAVIALRNPRSVLGAGIFDRVPYPGKVVRRPKFPGWIRNAPICSEDGGAATTTTCNVFYQLQDALDLHYLVPLSELSPYQSFSLRRYLRNIPPLGMARFPVCIDDGYLSGVKSLVQRKRNESDDLMKVNVNDINELEGNDSVDPEGAMTSSCFRIVPLPLPESPNVSPTATEASQANERARSGARFSILQSEIIRTVNQRRDDPAGGGGFGNPNPNNDLAVGVGNIPGGRPLLHGPGPRLLNLLWSISEQLGWAVDDGSQAATSVYVRRELLISLQWLSLTLMAAPLFWTLVARASHWVPAKPAEYLLEGIPYQLTSEMRFLSEPECGVAASALVMIWLFLGRWTERWTSRDFNRAMLEHVEPEPELTTTFITRYLRRLQIRWDELCPIFLQRFSYAPSWNTRSTEGLMNHICFWRSEDNREHKSVFPAAAGCGLMFCATRWDDILVTDQSSRKLLISAIAALGSFGSSTPHFWMNVLTVFSCSISLGLSMSLHSLEKGVTGGASASVACVLKSLNLPTFFLTFVLLGQLLGSSGGVLFLAEFVVTSISFILGGAGTISASSVESWGCFFCLSSTAFWGYLFGRVALMDGVTRQKRFVCSNLFSTTLLCASLAAVSFMWAWICLWRWDVPASLMILRTSVGVAMTARTGEASAASDPVARSAAAQYAAKNLQ